MTTKLGLRENSEVNVQIVVNTKVKSVLDVRQKAVTWVGTGAPVPTTTTAPVQVARAYE